MEDESDLTGSTPRRRPKPDVLEIGGRRLKPSTLMMGHGFDPALSEGSLKPPIFLTSTFVFENAAAGKRHFEGVTGKRPGGAMRKDASAGSPFSFCRNSGGSAVRYAASMLRRSFGSGWCTLARSSSPHGYFVLPPFVKAALSSAMARALSKAAANLPARPRLKQRPPTQPCASVPLWRHRP